MKYDQIKDLKAEYFRRYPGLKQANFEEMVTILKVSYSKKHKRGGRPAKLSIEDQLLLTMSY